jgi:Ca2+-binding RTX toxin-like protein
LKATGGAIFDLSGADVIAGFEIFGLAANQSITGVDGEFCWVGSNFDGEIFNLSVGDDTVFGRGGDDVIKGGGDDDFLDGGLNRDRLLGQFRDDRL